MDRHAVWLPSRMTALLTDPASEPHDVIDERVSSVCRIQQTETAEGIEILIE